MSPRRFPPAWRTVAVLGVVAIAAAVVTYEPKTHGTELVAVEGDAGAVLSDEAAGSAQGTDGERRVVTVVDKGSAGTAGQQASRTVIEGGQGTGASGPTGPIECAPGKNGGKTDSGVSGNEIKLGATVVDSGIGRDFLRDARYGMLAIKNRVNREGGICGRKLTLELVDDGWEAGRGSQFLRNLVEDTGVFALAVVPSSEGLRVVSDNGYLRSKNVPVVGTDGMLKHQYTDPLIWPVAASTISTMHIMADYAWNQLGARKIGLVYETTYHFGIEGAYAFNESIKRLNNGQGIPGYADPEGSSAGCSQKFCGIQAGQSSYQSQINEFNSACSDCDYVVLLLEPATALTWIKQGGLPQSDKAVKAAGVQPLFTRDFAQQCKQDCHNMLLWSGYIPAIDANLGRAAVAEFRDELNKTNSSADPTNTFVMGAYVGTKLLVEAMKAVGPNLTRQALIAQLDSMTFDSQLTAKPHKWSKGNHFANTTMQAYSIQYKDRFSGWRDEQVTRDDPWVGMDLR